MLFKKYIKNRRKLKILLLLMIVGLIVVTLVILHSSPSVQSAPRDEQRLGARAYVSGGVPKLEQLPLLLSPQQNGIIIPEKYDEHKIRARIIEDKIRSLKEQQKQQQRAADAGEEATATVGDAISQAVHIFYSAPVQWYKTKKSQQQLIVARDSVAAFGDEGNHSTVHNVVTHKPLRILNTAFYPALGLYQPTPSLLEKHFENIRKCGVGVLILSYTGKEGEFELYNRILDLVPAQNLSVIFEISVAGNQSIEFFRTQLLAIRKFSTAEGFYRVYSQTRQSLMPLVYVSNAYKLSDTAGRLLCHAHPDTLRRTFDAFFIGHIRLKNHAETMRRLCFDGFYSKLASNGATFASTWKNWSYLKSFAQTYSMLFVPTVGPGFAERNKFPRHGDIQRHRSNGRYYGVAWRSAIINHVGFISIASYNNWPDGSQIEEVIPKAGFLDYSPGSKTKYLDLTTHWVGNFLKTRRDAAAAGGLNCYEYLNNTIC